DAIAVGRIDPRVVVAPNRRGAAREVDARPASVDRLREFRRQEVELVLVVGLDGAPRVVMRPASKAAIGPDELPVFTAVIAAPERAGLRLGSIRRRKAIARFVQRAY